MKITAFDAVYSQEVGMGGTLLISSDGSNSGTSGGDITGESGDLSVVRLRSSVALSSNLTGTVGDVLTIIQNSPLTAQFATPSNSGGGAAFGSNTTRVSEIASVGFSSNTSRADHIHDGIGQVTASSSNTLQRGTLNLRPGTGMALALSDGDGSGSFDTITLVNTVAAGGGGSSGAPTTATYVVSAANASLSAEIVIPGMAGSPDISAGGASDDEFDQNTSGVPSGWTQLGSLSTVNTQDALSHVHMLNAGAGTAVDINGLYKASPSTPFTVTAKMASARYESATWAGLAIMESSPGKITVMYVGNVAAAPRGPQLGVAYYTNRTSFSSSPLAQTNLFGPEPIYLRIVVTSSTDVEFWMSRGGMAFSPLLKAHNPGYTVGAVGVLINSQSATQVGNAYFDWIRFT